MTNDTQPVRFDWRPVRPDEAETAYALHLEALSGMASGMVRPDTLAHFIRHIDTDGMILGGYVDGAGMVAYGVLGMRSDTASHMAQTLGVEASDRQRFGILDGAASLTAWRGQRLHRELIRARLQHAEKVGRTLIGATVAPGNVGSLRGLMDAHFQVSAFAMLYGGLARLVLMRDLLAANREWIFDRAVETTDVPAHKSALADGLAGFACREDPNGRWMIHYGCIAH